MYRSLAKLSGLAVAFCCWTGIGAAFAQTAKVTAVIAPRDVVLYIHAELKDTDFVEPLVCALRQVLTAGVDARNIRLPLGPESLATPTQFDVGKVSDQFARATASDGGSVTYKYLLVPYDLKDQTYRYVFATTFPRDYNGVVSMARLYVTDSKLSRHERAELAARRAYKLILKSIARLAGYTKPNGCILAFPRNLPELDAKSSEFCRDDHGALVDSGLLKADESGGCAFISQIMRKQIRVTGLNEVDLLTFETRRTSSPGSAR
jgi:predicted Zn-dependent protease